MKKRIISLLVISVLLMGALAGLAQAAEKTKIVWTWCCGQDSRKVLFESLAEKYEASHPDIDIQPIFPSGGNYVEILKTWVAGGTQLDVVWVGVDMWQLPFEPLDDVMASTPAADNIHPSLLDSRQWNGKQRVIPYGANTHVMAYNKNLLAQAGFANPTAEWTWDDAIPMAKAMTKDADGDGSPDQAGIAPLVNYNWIQYGGDFYTEDGRKARFANPVGIAGANLFIDLTKRLNVTPPDDLNFTNGTVGISQLAIFGVPSARKNASFDWDVVPAPGLVVDGKTYHNTFVSTESWGLNATSTHKKEAKEFIAWLIGNEAMSEIAKSGIVVPTSLAVSDIYYQQPSPPNNLQAFVDSFGYGHQLHLSHPIGREVHGVLTSNESWAKMWNGEADPAIVLPQLQTQVNALLDEYWNRQ